GQAEVHQLHLTILADEDVGRRDVAVHDAERPAGVGIANVVRVGEALANLHHQVQRVRDAHPLALALERLDDGLQVRAVDVLHDDEVHALGNADVEHLDDVGVLQMQREPRLIQEHADELFVLGEVRKDALDGDVLLEPLQRFRDCAEHFGHAAGVDTLGDLVFLFLGHTPSASYAATSGKRQADVYHIKTD